MLCGLGEGPRARRRRRDASAEQMRFGCQFFLEAAARARAIRSRPSSAEGVPARPERWRRGGGQLVLAAADHIAHEKRPRAARSGDYGSRFGLARPQGIRAAFRAPVIIRFPRAAAANELLLANIHLESPPPRPDWTCEFLLLGVDSRRAGWYGGRLRRAFPDLATSNADGRAPARE